MITYRNLLLFCFYIEVISCKLKNGYDFRTSEALVQFQIFELCEKNYQTIVINDNSEKLDLRWFQQLHEKFHAVILYKERLEYHDNYFYTTKVDTIIITISSFERLEEVFDNLFETVWWNVMIPIYILNLSDNDCELATDILEQAWDDMILTSYYLCIENNEVQIYTYNPFTNRAPNNWIEVSSSSEESNWTLYRRKYQTGTICQGLDFDRTKHLDGYPITVVTPRADGVDRSYEGMFIEYDDLPLHGQITEKRYHFLMDVLAVTLNVRPNLCVTKKTYYDNKTGMTYLTYAMKTAKEESAHLILTDYYLSGKFNLGNDEYTRTYPLGWYEKRIATYNRGYRTLAEKVWDFYGIWTILFTIFVLIITFIVIWYTESKKSAFAVFEIIRLLISHGLYTRMNTLALRIFFISVLIYFLIIQATFNGHLAKFLTKPELRKHAETYKDLAGLGYTKIYDARYIEQHLLDTVEKKSYYSDLVRSCLRLIIYNDSSVACIFNERDLFRYYRMKRAINLYVSKRSLGTLYLTFVIKKNWPLSNRVNNVILSLDELGFRKLRSAQLMHNVTHRVIVTEAKSRNDFQPIKLENLMFGFLILAIGLVSATFSFCVEIVISSRSKWNVISHVENNERKTLQIRTETDIQSNLYK